MRYIASSWSTAAELDWVRDHATDKYNNSLENIGNKGFIKYSTMVRN